ncbi:hypothetical protein J6TS2_39650 [Heyndrickxia sporothermodurans]|nr:hypothetical protein J6TS2_39650 [Heyndrickxia sporothermodurans]
MRYVFYKRSNQLTENDKWYLHRYLDLSPELRKAYELKELFCRWFDEAKQNGEDRILQTKNALNRFYEEVDKGGIPEFTRAAQTLKNWQIEILNSSSYNFSNGFLEGINNLTKVIKRNAFGFRSFLRFRAEILLTQKYKRLGSHIG